MGSPKKKRSNWDEWFEAFNQLEHPSDRMTACYALIGCVLDSVPASVFDRAMTEMRERFQIK